MFNFKVLNKKIKKIKNSNYSLFARIKDLKMRYMTEFMNIQKLSMD